MKRNANGQGSITKNVTVKNGKTYVNWVGRVMIGTDPGTGKRIIKSVSAPTQKEAAAKLKALIRRVDDHTYTETPKLSLSAWLDTWLEDYAAPGLKPLSVETYKSRIDTHIKPALGALRLTAITVPDLQHFCNSLSKKLSPKTTIAVMAILQEALAQAVELSYLPNNPAERVKRPRKEQKEIKPLTESEVTALLKLLKDGDVTSDMIIFTLFTGLREGEVCGLPWSAVDFVHDQITVRQQLQKGKAAGSSYTITTAKEDKTRTLTLAPSVMDVLRARKRTQEQQRREAGLFWQNDLDFVFTQADGKFIPPQTFLKRLKRLLEQIGRPDAYVHTLRHTYAVMALQEGDDIKTVQDNLGHATAAFTLDVYGHVSEKMKKESAERTEKLIRNLRA